jgi:hypothetical protein
MSTATALLDLARALDPALILSDAGYEPDAWQTAALRSTAARCLWNVCRSGGKSTTAAALAVREALFAAPALVLVLSPTQRQSGELFRRVKLLYNALGRPAPAVQESALTMELANGSRVVALPGNDEATVRSYSGVRLLVIDEAARVGDDLYRAVRPMVSVSRGAIVALSTPNGKRGWWHAEWAGSAAWERVRVSADRVSRIPAEFLAEERQALGERWFRQEYFNEFGEPEGAAFDEAAVRALLSDEVRPLSLGLGG